MIKGLILILIIPVIVQGQDNKILPRNAPEASAHFELGIRGEYITMYGNYFNRKTTDSSPISLHIAAGEKFSKHYKTDLRFGFNYISDIRDFGGWDAGIYFLGDLFNTDIFGTAGIDFFDVFDFGHGTASGGGMIVFYCFGLGYNFSRNFESEITYCIPQSKRYGQDAAMGPNFDETYYRTVNGLLKIGFQYSFIF